MWLDYPTRVYSFVCIVDTKLDWLYERVVALVFGSDTRSFLESVEWYKCVMFKGFYVC